MVRHVIRCGKSYVCECTIGVDVRDGTTSVEAIVVLFSVLSNIVMGCIVL